MRKSLIIALLLSSFATTPVIAQRADPLVGRVDRLEREVRAVQRKVFPGGGTNELFQAEIQPESQPLSPSGTPATAPITDLTARVDALESQLASLTGQTEQNAYQIRQLNAQVEKLVADAQARAQADVVSPPPVTPTLPGEAAQAPQTDERQAAVAAIARPSSGEAAEDGYLYGYRLWEAKLYPEAQAQLKETAEKYPNHRRATFARNLLGRAYLDDGKPALASVAFYDNYDKNPDGERAPDSLLYLGMSLIEMKKPGEACKVFDELQDKYGASLSSSLKDQAAKGRIQAKCK